jgi:hypothetical protein
LLNEAHLRASKLKIIDCVVNNVIQLQRTSCLRCYLLSHTSSRTESCGEKKLMLSDHVKCGRNIRIRKGYIVIKMCHVGHTGIYLITEVKQRWARLVLRRVIAQMTSMTGSDRPKTFSAEYSSENYRPNIRPKRIFGKCCRKRKKVLFSNFSFPSNIFPRK